ncbi:extracellular solute-binding protein [Labrys monachus]|uniref:Iron(III) transport system substrate-binding protein n=1 Tax=Labrys monachus TaxID=217067 RepID=A0ABU0FE14_9HYPH|nr:extracellular solute-binding protein [Labrys monachus]MDQ0392766.1 iron(III) transport system substrate-binding protein [Labrys monachus]
MSFRSPGLPLRGRGPGRIRGLTGLVLLAGAVAVASTPAAADAVKLTLYSAQHQQMVEMLTSGFTKQTGIEVAVHKGEAPEIANQIAQEGSSSPADLYITENSPELLLLEEKGLLAKVDPATLASVPSAYSSPTGAWVGVLARENVLVYNKSMIGEGDLPASLLDLAKPAWKGKVAIAPTDADFMPLLSAVKVLVGKDGAIAWLKGLKDNAAVYDDDEGVVAAVDRGSAATGIINSYYFERYRVETGDDKIHSAIHHFGGGDAGALVNVSGAAVLKSSHNQEAAQKFLAYIVSKPAQAALAASDVDFEYPLAAGVPANPALKPFAQLQPPRIDLAHLGDDQDAAEMLREAGLL